ncbi:hypothetical protein B296_00021274 [Ensete ventricosum]|uniref:Uncharacterized protein n=1 Tax=Ensete ventricosum TaxID=4639 RepID=A0A427AU41_ENSVE|nr:hypothetical protein B296_00021274 [Ensete ventricosum]
MRQWWSTKKTASCERTPCGRVEGGGVPSSVVAASTLLQEEQGKSGRAREGGAGGVTGDRKLCTGASQNAGPVLVRQAPKERWHPEAVADTPESRSSRRREERRRKKQLQALVVGFTVLPRVGERQEQRQTRAQKMAVARETECRS